MTDPIHEPTPKDPGTEAPIARNALVQLAMRRPITMVVLAVAIALGAVVSLAGMQFDIFPDLGSPVIYVVEPYGGLDPGQIESFITYNFESQFFYVNGIEHIESKSIGQVSLIKLQFYEGTDMSRAMAEVVAYSSRALKNMPPGTLPPLILRFDSGSLPVGDLVFSSPTRSLGSIADYALNYVRPQLATLPGILAPNPFGSSPRTIVIEVDPAKLGRYALSPEDVAIALSKSNLIEPSGNLPVGGKFPLVPINSMVGGIDELLDVPLRLGTSPTVFLKDVGRVVDGTDLQVGYAILNGRPTVYLPVTKHSDASTLTVVDEIRRSMALFQAALPEDIKVGYEFDQSGMVKDSVLSLAMEGALGAALTGLMVLLFLGDWRSAVVVVLNIPLAVMGAVVCLKVAHQTVNIMTLGGLALAVGILVDESTITIENIHVRLSRGDTLADAAINGASEIFVPALLTMFCILAVFIPAFFMGGMAKGLFVPLTLSVGFAIVWAFLMSMTLVPILSTWILRRGHAGGGTDAGFMGRLKALHGRLLGFNFRHRKAVLALYGAANVALVAGLGMHIGREIFPQTDSGGLQIRVRAPSGTPIEETRADLLKVVSIIRESAGDASVDTSLGYVGTQPTQYALNNIFLWTSGPQEAVLQVSLNKGAARTGEALKEDLRARFKRELPGIDVTFEAAGLVDQVMGAGSPTPIEVDVNGRDLASDRRVAAKVLDALRAVPGLRDLVYGQPFDYPSVSIKVDRAKAGRRGASVADIGRSIVPVTSSSRFTLPNFWEDRASGVNYQVQVEVPQGGVRSIADLRKVPVTVNGGSLPLDDFADVSTSSQAAEYDRYNMQRMATVTGNLHGVDLGHAGALIAAALDPLRKDLPRGTQLKVRGQVQTLQDMSSGLVRGLLFSVVVILLLLASSFESVPIALIVVSNVPAVLSGSLACLVLTGSTLNVESFMGTIMSVGVSVANSILLVTFADITRRSGRHSFDSAMHGAQSRLRPVLMTSIAMIVGMVPMALGLSESGQQSAPLARAVIGGLAASTLSTLLIMPVIYAMAHRDKPVHTASLDPSDPHSAFFVKEA